ncbi:hypothetical protein BREVUG8_30070 [Brevundimonas sp. G8]|nr:hypothetical protein BREVUG8_30070 [Brevundimonas sp. G8]
MVIRCSATAKMHPTWRYNRQIGASYNKRETVACKNFTPIYCIKQKSALVVYCELRADRNGRMKYIRATGFRVTPQSTQNGEKINERNISVLL